MRVVIDIERQTVFAYSPGQTVEGLYFEPKYQILMVIPYSRSGKNPFNLISEEYPGQDFVNGDLGLSYDNCGRLEPTLSVGANNFYCTIQRIMTR
jgi:hypothetical protein